MYVSSQSSLNVMMNNIYALMLTDFSDQRFDDC